jgi:hypothetical protein
LKKINKKKIFLEHNAGFSLWTPKRNFVFIGKSEVEAQDWKNSIQKVIEAETALHLNREKIRDQQRHTIFDFK